MKQLTILGKEEKVRNTKTSISVLREKMSYYGAGNLNTPELLTIITGNKASDLLHKLFASNEFANIIEMTEEDFKQHGFTSTVASKLVAAFALYDKVAKYKPGQKPQIKGPVDAYNVFRSIEHEEQEHFVVALVNTKNFVISVETIFKGTLNACMCHPREIFKLAVRKNAGAIITAHNHPSGILDPSGEDQQVCRRIKEVGEILGIQLLDNLIVAKGKFLSFKEKGLL